MNDPITLSTAELQVLSELDSRQFGFIKLNQDGFGKKKAIALKAIQYLERLIVQSQIEAKRRGSGDDNNNEKTISDRFIVDPKTYCKLGHLHLLLEDYSKALSAYQKYFKLVKDHWKDPVFLYGQGLVYFQYNAFQWATKAFQQVLYIDPGFKRANEVHLRLGLMAKVNKDFETSLKHFELPLNDPAPCSFTSLEIRFHISHLFEIKGQHADAKKRYEDLLNESDLPTHLRADIYRQLGWMYHSVDALGEKTQRIDQAIQCLQKSIESDPKSGQSLYLLGRCYASIGKVHDAFIAYRNSVDKSESNADTWCSIGVLYQQQNQPMDALQAYICAVQLDKSHSAAWTNLGILYESQSQPQDALACYNNATRNKSPNPNLHQRIKYLKTQMGNAPPPAASAKPRTLPTVEEAWNLPISNEMTNRQSNQPRQGVARPGTNANDPKRFVKQEDGAPAPQPQQRPPFYLNQQQLQTLQYLQNQPSLLPQQQQILQQLQHQFRLMQQHQQQMRLQAQQQAQQAQLAGGGPLPRPSQPGQGFSEGSSSGPSGGEGSDGTGFGVSDKELESLLSQQDIGSFAESLLKQFQEQIGDSSETAASSDDSKADSKADAAAAILAEMTGDKDKKDSIMDSLRRESEEKLGHMDIPTSLETVLREKHEKPKINIEMSAEDIVEACFKTVPTTGHISTSVLSEDLPPPCPPERPAVKLSKEQLLPPTPSVYLENKKDAFSPQLQEFCLQHPITVVRGLAAALKLDLGLFATKTLVELQPNHPMQVLNQMKQGSDENWDPVQMKQVWKCESSLSTTSIGKYAIYQTTTFQESLLAEQEKTSGSTHRPDEVPDPSGKKKKLKSGPTLKFGYNLELSDERKWRHQLQELMKLPSWTRVVSAGNMLSHMGYQILGMNTVKLYMKVPCARSVAHQENNLFCSININIGPGDCEWFGVPDDYWGVLQQLCGRNDVNYLNGSWWPNMKDLMDSEIPVYRFLQRPGDLVWVNSGCVHWVQAAGWCNNIAWNVGPMTHRQYSLALERYEWNKLKSNKSSVAMVYLSWNLARNVRLSEVKLFETIKHTLMRSLRQVVLSLEYVKSKEIELKFHGRGRGEPAHYCVKCENEVFGVLFIREQEKKHVVRCFDCARRHHPDLKGFVCLEEYHMKELKEVYNNFKIASANVPPMHTGMTPPGMNSHQGMVGMANVSPSTPQRSFQPPMSQHNTSPQAQHRKPHNQMSSHALLASSMLTPQQQLAQLQALQQQAMMPP